MSDDTSSHVRVSHLYDELLYNRRYFASDQRLINSAYKLQLNEYLKLAADGCNLRRLQRCV